MTDGVTWTLRLTATDPDAARVSVRRQQFLVGRPIEFDEESPRVSALDYVLGAVAGEVVGGLRVFASRRRIDVEQIEAVVTADLEHALAYLEVVGVSGQPRIARIHVKVFVAASDASAIRGLWVELLDRLPVVCTLRRAVDLELELIITP
jgi:uncharacterized OsmC-like protein